MQEQLRIGVDGVTINQTIDLLLDSPEPIEIEHRRSARHGYLRSLEQFISACIFTDVLVFDRKIIAGSLKQDAALPFMERLSKTLPGGPDRIVFDSLPSPAKLLTDRRALSRTRRQLTQLGSVVVSPDQTLWRDHIIRECGNYLGNHPTLKQRNLPLHALRFGEPDGVERDFFVNENTDAIVRPIMSAIPEAALTWFVTNCQKFSPAAADHSRRAILEFCRRNIFAHVLIGENTALFLDNDAGLAQPQEPIGAHTEQDRVFSDVWLCATRQSLIECAFGAPDAQSQPGTPAPIRMVLPYVLDMVLRGASPTATFSSIAHGIAAVWDRPEYRELRKLLLDQKKQPNKKNLRQLNWFTRELNRQNLSAGDYSVMMSTPDAGKVLPKLTSELNRPVPYIVARTLPSVLRARWAARMIGRQGRIDVVHARVREALARVFPNTFGS